MSNIKVAALKLAQKSPEFRRALLEEISKGAASKEKKKTKAIQKAYFAFGVGLDKVRSAIRHKDFKGDTKLKDLVSKVVSDQTKLVEHLDKNYEWDWGV